MDPRAVLTARATQREEPRRAAPPVQLRCCTDAFALARVGAAAHRRTACAVPAVVSPEFFSLTRRGQE
jgi:hypothetical protein